MLWYFRFVHFNNFTFSRMKVFFDPWLFVLTKITVHYSLGPSTLIQVTVQFISRPSSFGRTVNFHATVHYHPFTPFTLDQTRDSLDFSGTNIYLCGHRYFQYPVVTDIYVSPSHHTSRNFPTLTICLNSMHADFKVKQFHDDDGKLSDSLRPVSKNNCNYM